MKAIKTIYIVLLLAAYSCSQQGGTESDADDHGHSHGEGTHSHTHGDDNDQEQFSVVTDTLEKQTVAATDISPEYVQLATGLRIIPNIKDAVESVGVLTHEGVFGPLLFAKRSRAFFIELKPGMFLAEHPHPNESLVFTVSGRWVLCSEGKRQVMETGSMFHFGDNIPTGWEAPFAEGALLYVVKTKEEGAGYEPYMKGLRDMVSELDDMRTDGMEFYYNELPEDHVAIQFARSVNPDFDAVLASIKY
ncbi:MAG: cupin domain-containing protein [Bacteroidota bacterium]